MLIFNHFLFGNNEIRQKKHKILQHTFDVLLYTLINKFRRHPQLLFSGIEIVRSPNSGYYDEQLFCKKL